MQIYRLQWERSKRQNDDLTENDGHENDEPICRTWNCKTGKCRTWKRWTKNYGRARSCRRTNRVLTQITLQWSVHCANFKTQNTVIHCAYSFIPACAQVDKLSPLYFNLRHFSNRSSNRLQRSNAKSTQYIQPQTFAASVSVSYPALLCPAISRPAFSAPPDRPQCQRTVICQGRLFDRLLVVWRAQITRKHYVNVVVRRVWMEPCSILYCFYVIQ